jgi:hypothetical protein
VVIVVVLLQLCLLNSVMIVIQYQGMVALQHVYWKQALHVQEEVSLIEMFAMKFVEMVLIMENMHVIQEVLWEQQVVQLHAKLCLAGNVAQDPLQLHPYVQLNVGMA